MICQHVICLEYMYMLIKSFFSCVLMLSFGKIKRTDSTETIGIIVLKTH